MNQATFTIQTAVNGIVHLSKAILIYQGTSEAAFATVHDIAEFNGEAVIQAGKAMTPSAAVKLARSLSASVTHGGFLPETVLYLDGDVLVWWVPPRERHIVFLAEKIAETERGEVVPHPGLVFAASSRRWMVWAVKGKKRPTLQSKLYYAPYFNVWESGEICRGNVQIPDGTTADKIDAWNDAFFRSVFTHPNGSRSLVNYEGGAYAFWRDMLDGRFKTFPQRVLNNTKLTLGQVLGLTKRIEEGEN